jgi:hypothetical protein
MKILPEDSIEFLDQVEFTARRIVVVGESYRRCGDSHIRDRMMANKAYCYEDISVIPIVPK